MSVHVMSWVLRHSEERLGNRLVLLVLADHAGADGTEAYPSIDTIAAEAKLSRSQVIRCLKTLRDKGAIVQYDQRPSGVYEYKVVMEQGSQYDTPQGSHPRNEGVASTTPGGSQDDTRTVLRTVQEQPPKTLAAVAAYDPRKGMKLDGRNLPWDALVEVTQADETVEAGQIAKALKMIRLYVAATLSDQVISQAPENCEFLIAQQIRARARLYRDRWPNMELTPTALAKNWARVLTEAPGRSLDTALEAAQRGIDEARRTA